MVSGPRRSMCMARCSRIEVCRYLHAAAIVLTTGGRLWWQCGLGMYWMAPPAPGVPNTQKPSTTVNNRSQKPWGSFAYQPKNREFVNLKNKTFYSSKLRNSRFLGSFARLPNGFWERFLTVFNGFCVNTRFCVPRAKLPHHLGG